MLNKEFLVPLESADKATTKRSRASIYALETRLFRKLDSAITPRLVQIDLVIQVTAGIAASLGGMVFLAQLGRETTLTKLFWTAIELSLIYFFIFQPSRELKRRRTGFGYHASATRARWRATKPGEGMGYALLASLLVVFVEFVIAMYRGGILLASQLPILFSVGIEALSKSLDPHGSGPSHHLPAMPLPPDQVQFAALLFFVWFGSTTLLVVLVMINDIFVYPTLNDPALRSSVRGWRVEFKQNIALIYRLLQRLSPK